VKGRPSRLFAPAKRQRTSGSLISPRPIRAWFETMKQQSKQRPLIVVSKP
jgi:hypothetical protein